MLLIPALSNKKSIILKAAWTLWLSRLYRKRLQSNELVEQVVPGLASVIDCTLNVLFGIFYFRYSQSHLLVEAFALFQNCFFSDEMLPTPIPEIQRSNLASTLLQLKAMGINNLIDFDFMDSPPIEAMITALTQLHTLSALDNDGLLTALGKKVIFSLKKSNQFSFIFKIFIFFHKYWSKFLFFLFFVFLHFAYFYVFIFFIFIYYSILLFFIFIY